MTRPSSLLIILSLSFIYLTLSAAAHGGHHDDSGGGSEPSPSPNLRSRSLILVKVWCLVLVFAGTFLAGISPCFFKWNEGFLVLGTQFAGGVFLGTSMMHFLSDADATFHDLVDKEYPFAFMLACFGYLVTMLADCVVGYVCRKKDEKGVGGPVGGGNVEEGRSREKEEAADHGLPIAATDVKSIGNSVLLIVALCFHSVFEGIAIGVAETQTDAWKVLWTVCLHKLFAAIAMGIALLRMIPDRPIFSCVAYAFAFAISSPIGVAFGIIIDATTQGAVADWIYAISMGLACGVFIYVSINHLLSMGYTPHGEVTFGSPFHKFFAVALGTGVIAVVMIWDT
ncbi:hypothetical protein MLD38_035066 [Melastoma candidum]|uniref:Uncharacterized protein n=1 Tax=Melastoma candidum TaxID=119954 RepID=A0ACB9MBN8_9MYRT|nr:hypothetical protein MLD38_035066 [Melastoma candidum]